LKEEETWRGKRGGEKGNMDLEGNVRGEGGDLEERV